MPQDFNLYMCVHVFGPCMCVYVCVCEHADEAEGEPAPQWVGRWGRRGCGDKYTLCCFPGMHYVACCKQLPFGAIWCWSQMCFWPL